MSAHAFYLWASYGMFALAIAVELFLLRRRRALARQHALLLSQESPAPAARVTANQAPSQDQRVSSTLERTP
jgi:heme exporter protein CcmD